MNRAKTGTLPKVRPAALSGSENWGATVVILGGNGYNKSYKTALSRRRALPRLSATGRENKDPFAGRPLEKSS